MARAFSVTIRSLAGAALMALVLLPAWDLLPATRWNLHVWSRLRAAGRDAPDSGADRFHQQLAAALPATGAIGFVSADANDRTGTSRMYTLMQYALAPRQIVWSTDTEFVIVFSPTSADWLLLRDPRYTIVSSPGSGLYVLHRLAR